MSRLLTILGIVLWLLGFAALVGALLIGWAAQNAWNEIFAGILFLSFLTGLGFGALCLAAAWFVPRFESFRKQKGDGRSASSGAGDS